MSYSRGAYNYSTVSAYAKPQQQISPQNVIGGAALAFASLACLGSLAANLFGGDAAPAAADNGAEIVTITQQRSLGARSAVASFFSSTYSFGGPRVTFEVPALAKGDRLPVFGREPQIAQIEPTQIRTVPV
ncbi:MAG: hypothetical protein K2X60_09695, partial [Xanthobacteraceae bacterium]|nr:hypothetical protein [Xanthobacteraceae bacterium]